MPEDIFLQYQAIAVSTEYFRTAAAENEHFAETLRTVANGKAELEKFPLLIISSTRWYPLAGIDGFSEVETEQARQAWQGMQSDMRGLSTKSRQILALQSGHYIQFDQPELVVEAIREIVIIIEE
jgi:hypothetical protein